MISHLVQYTTLFVSAPARPTSTSSLHFCSSPRQSAATTLCPKRRYFSRSNFCTVSRIYARILSPLAIVLLLFHGLNGNPKVCRSESLRTPGYLNSDHVPPISWRASSTA